jgi:hypothetical protein
MGRFRRLAFSLLGSTILIGSAFCFFAFSFGPSFSECFCTDCSLFGRVMVVHTQAQQP